jgi:hypothetical protein
MCLLGEAAHSALAPPMCTDRSMDSFRSTQRTPLLCHHYSTVSISGTNVFTCQIRPYVSISCVNASCSGISTCVNCLQASRNPLKMLRCRPEKSSKVTQTFYFH